MRNVRVGILAMLAGGPLLFAACNADSQDLQPCEGRTVAVLRMSDYIGDTSVERQSTVKQIGLALPSIEEGYGSVRLPRTPDRETEEAWEFDCVPEGEYLLRMPSFRNGQDEVVLVSSADTVDLGDSALYPPGNTTSIRYDLELAMRYPQESPEPSEIHLRSFGAGIDEVYYLLNTNEMPSHSLAVPLNARRSFDDARGDRLWVFQRVWHSPPGGYARYSSVSRFGSVASLEQPVQVDLWGFYSQTPFSVDPPRFEDVTEGGVRFALYAAPDELAPCGTGSIPLTSWFDDDHLPSDLPEDVPVYYAIPEDWSVFVQYEANSSKDIAGCVPGPSWDGSPLVGKVSDVRANGRPLDVDLRGVGRFVTLTWEPPSVGFGDVYFVKLSGPSQYGTKSVVFVTSHASLEVDFHVLYGLERYEVSIWAERNAFGAKAPFRRVPPWGIGGVMKPPGALVP